VRVHGPLQMPVTGAYSIPFVVVKLGSRFKNVFSQCRVVARRVIGWFYLLSITISFYDQLIISKDDILQILTAI
jgi:hypothetical protein